MALGSQDLQFRILASVAGQQAIDALKGSLDSVNKASNLLTKGFEALAVGFSVEKITSFGESILENADQLGKLSEKTGISVDTLAKFQGAASLAGVPLDELAKGLAKLGKNTVDASNGNFDLQNTFSKLGVSIKDQNGQVKNAGDVLKDLSDKFVNLKDGPEKAQIAIKLFGKAGADLIPLLDQGSEELERFGLNIDQDFATRATNFNESLKSIGINLQNNAIDNIKVVLPVLNDLAEAFDDFTKQKGDTVGFMEALGEAGRQMANLLVLSFDAVKSAIDASVTGFREAYAFIKGNDGEVARLDAGLQARLKATSAAEDAFLLKANKNSLIFGEGSTDEILARQQAPATQRKKGTSTAQTSGENDKLLHAFDERIAKINAETSAIGESNVEKQTSVLLAELEAKGIAKSSAAYQTYSEKITNAVTALETAKEKQQATDLGRKNDEQVALQTLQIQGYALSSAELQKLVEAKTLDNQATEATLKFTEEGRQAYLDTTETIKAQKAALIDLQEQQKQTWSVGASEAFRDYLENAKNVAEQTRQLFGHAFSNMEDSLVSFVKTGKLNFQKFADDVITDLIRIQVKALLVQAITGASGLFSGLFSGAATAPAGAVAGGAGDAGGAVSDVAFAANGGVMTQRGMAPLRKYAGGGIASSPQLAVFGEGSRPEAYVPLPDGRRIPVDLGNQSQGSGGTMVSVTVNMGDNTTDSKASSSQGTQLGRIIANAVKAEIVNQKRPGGVLS